MIRTNIVTKKKLTLTATLGAVLLSMPLLIIYSDPLFLYAKYKLRLTEGSILHEVLKNEMEGARIAIYVYNITNGDRFVSGEDYKLKLQEVGPFVYQEYRSNKDIEFDIASGVVRFTPQYRAVFLPDQSLGRPEDFLLNVPNVSFLSIASLLNNYPFLIKNLFNVMARQIGTRPIIPLDAQSQLWGYHDPIVKLASSLAPGLLYYDSIGVLERLYDENAVYRIEMGTSGDDKFKVKSLEKYRRDKEFEKDDLVHSKTLFSNTYEGAAFPTEMTSQTPVNVLRLGVCKPMHFRHAGEMQMQYGAKAFVYEMHNDTFENNNLCYSNGLCPKQMADLSECFFGLPVTLSKTYLQDSDAEVLERLEIQDRIDQLEGVNSDPDMRTSRMLVDPRIGVTVGTTLLLQANILLTDLSHDHGTRMFSNMVLPVAHANATFPELPSETKHALTLMYSRGPQIALYLEIASGLLGLLLLLYSAHLFYSYHIGNTNQSSLFNQATPSHKHNVTAQAPLIHE